MPQTTPERAARWPGGDQEAIRYLTKRGYKLNRDWSWSRPERDMFVVSIKDADAAQYRIEEWDFDGIRMGETSD